MLAALTVILLLQIINIRFDCKLSSYALRQERQSCLYSKRERDRVERAEAEMVKPDYVDLGPGHKRVPKRKCIFYYFLYQNIHKIQETANDRKQINRMYFYYFAQTTAKRRTEVPKKVL